ncbi:hypothetical protein SAMD00019534_098330, partial [Acytostelium subglobosum LB1]|uniref:hypothetical protein n=1 Tax=Acytostelium subglobosum LB1 TaxID=1410327 RepID=UPI000644E38C
LNKAIFGVGPNVSTPDIFGISLDKNYFGGISLGYLDPLFSHQVNNYTSMLKTDGVYSFKINGMVSQYNPSSYFQHYKSFQQSKFRSSHVISCYPQADHLQT